MDRSVRVLVLFLLCFPKLNVLEMNVYHFCDPREKRTNICPNSMFKNCFFPLSLSERSISAIFPIKKRKKEMFLVRLARSECERGRSHPLPPRAFPPSPLPFHTNQVLLELDLSQPSSPGSMGLELGWPHCSGSAGFFDGAPGE